MYKQILYWFLDYWSPDIPFSLEKIVEIGQAHGKPIGEWFGPSTVAQALW
jgi:cysteine protease ATG4